MTRTINNYIEKEEIAKKAKVETTGDDMREGLTCVLSVKVPEPKFSSQTKDSLVSSEVQPWCRKSSGRSSPNSSWRSPPTPRSSAPRSSKRRVRAKPRARRASSRGARACSTAAACPASSPIARSAIRRCASSTWSRATRPAARAKQGRDRRNQAILPLKGKILNVERARIDKIITSQEVATLITALGAGIGEDFNLEKLRYHRVIIMTDADVDGAHIRTLLLTFFYRQMPALLEQGHIYVAQPPLYKVKSGKDERYLKDEHELKQHQLRRALNGATLFAGRGRGPARGGSPGEDRHRLPHDGSGDRAAVGGHGCGGAARDARHAAQSRSATRKAPPQAAKAFHTALLPNAPKTHIERDPDLRRLAPAPGEDRPRQQGRNRDRPRVPGKRRLRADREDSTDAGGTDPRGCPGAARRVTSRSIKSFREGLDWLLAEAKGSMAIQRYKGLGEMNPEQLWETTMDPTKRILLRVQIEDAISAGEIFSTLMGDEVEPRRQFIETNALGVSNLDV